MAGLTTRLMKLQPRAPYFSGGPFSWAYAVRTFNAVVEAYF